MPPASQWTLRRAGWASGFAWTLVVAGLASLAYISSLVAAAAAVATWRFRHRTGLVSVTPYGLLRINSQGQWEVVHRAKPQRLSLQHVWSGGAWMTLRFERFLDSGKKETVQYTVWRACVSAQAWRQLRIATLRHAVLSAQVAPQELP